MKLRVGDRVIVKSSSSLSKDFEMHFLGATGIIDRIALHGMFVSIKFDNEVLNDYLTGGYTDKYYWASCNIEKVDDYYEI